MKVYVQVVDVKTAIYQTGMIDEPVLDGFEIENALRHFGIFISEVDWINQEYDSKYIFKNGKVKDTSKIVSILAIY